MAGSADLADAVEEWADRGLPTEGACTAPFLAVVDTTTFLARWRAIGGDPTKRGCETVEDYGCLALFTDVAPSADEVSVVYLNAALVMSTDYRADALHHELFHVLRACHEGSPDQRHVDVAVWTGDRFANN
jgi:hypothetical protein